MELGGSQATTGGVPDGIHERFNTARERLQNAASVADEGADRSRGTLSRMDRISVRGAAMRLQSRCAEVEALCKEVAAFCDAEAARDR